MDRLSQDLHRLQAQRAPFKQSRAVLQAFYLCTGLDTAYVYETYALHLGPDVDFLSLTQHACTMPYLDFADTDPKDFHINRHFNPPSFNQIYRISPMKEICIFSAYFFCGGLIGSVQV
jgi:hypothetical protein